MAQTNACHSGLCGGLVAPGVSSRRRGTGVSLGSRVLCPLLLLWLFAPQGIWQRSSCEWHHRTQLTDPAHPPAAPLQSTKEEKPFSLARP